MSNVFHPGEQAMQRLLGVQEKMRVLGSRVIRDYMPEQHRDFFAGLQSLYVGGEDAQGDVWASVLHGETGFIASPDERTLVTSLSEESRHAVLPDDPIHEALRAGAQLGLLGIEFHSRRRNRVNVRVSAVNGETLTLHVEQSFGNCAKYIQQRDIVDLGTGQPRSEAITGMTAQSRAMVAGADTIFLATRYRQKDSAADLDEARRNGFDMSHRGGRPGFVVWADDRLWIPDYPGNRFFNTYGNLLLDPAMGLLVMDFANGSYLQLSGQADVVLEPRRIPIADVERAIAFQVRKGVIHHGALPWRFSAAEYSPNCPVL